MLGFKSSVTRFLSDSRTYKGLGSIVLAALAYVFLPSDMPEAARRSAFVFVLAAFFWALEIIPLYTTSLLVIILQTFLLCRPGGVLGMDKEGYQVFMLPFGSPIIILFFGGFVLAAALHKYHIDRMIASSLLKVFGTNPFCVLVGFLFSTAFMSMWMSNTATTAMMMAMVLPLLRQMDPKDPLRVALVLAIPFGANIGGMGTPVGTPPNAIALGILANHGIHVGFVAWMKMAVPLVIILLAVVAGLLYVLFPPKEKQLNLSITVERALDHKSLGVIAISVFTLLLWLTSEFHKIPEGLVALLAVGLFYSFSLMDREDFKSIDWDVLVLMWGGLALGKALEVSGLTKWFVGLPFFAEHSGFVLVGAFALLAVTMSTFMSNTAATNLIVPIAISIPGGDPMLMGIVVGLATSFAMALPISTPPNAIAFSTNMVKAQDMLKAGLMVSAISLIIMMMGYKFMITKAVGM